MSDSYQPIYDAVRSRISNGDVGAAVSEAASRAFDISHVTPLAQETVGIIQTEWTRPSVLFRPRVYRDGDSWCALYGESLVEGVAGFGSSPSNAMYDFDKNWNASAEAAA